MWLQLLLLESPLLAPAAAAAVMQMHYSEWSLLLLLLLNRRSTAAIIAAAAHAALHACYTHTASASTTPLSITAHMHCSIHNVVMQCDMASHCCLLSTH
jgi:hypothetical protein